MLIVESDQDAVESDLAAGRLRCVECLVGVLGKWGFARGGCCTTARSFVPAGGCAAPARRRTSYSPTSAWCATAARR
ncbi:MAG: hypothetical protein ACRDV4_01890, partial [Acidimicrobiales bacterium]